MTVYTRRISERIRSQIASKRFCIAKTVTRVLLYCSHILPVTSRVRIEARERKRKRPSCFIWGLKKILVCETLVMIAE